MIVALDEEEIREALVKVVSAKISQSLDIDPNICWFESKAEISPISGKEILTFCFNTKDAK